VTTTPHRAVGYWLVHELYHNGPASHYELFQARVRWDEERGRPGPDGVDRTVHVLVARALTNLKRKGHITRERVRGHLCWRLTDAGEEYVEEQIARRARQTAQRRAQEDDTHEEAM
jgi:hypothetical protein